ncbi:hypothetical protein [Psittacicella hinzii]|uniref:Uncharacterized protein n=1 Tax=Psittacicella hinzii TaxID=2028575 RepID=A0A3A1YA93_9GAMM|nr:hypothetical protein [Psittacicella hinzii]RIY35072.1 hypothetical protein CKF58_07135 [Psittacicella hinzii]
MQWLLNAHAQREVVLQQVGRELAFYTSPSFTQGVYRNQQASLLFQVIHTCTNFNSLPLRPNVDYSTSYTFERHFCQPYVDLSILLRGRETNEGDVQALIFQGVTYWAEFFQRQAELDKDSSMQKYVQ